MNYYDEIKNKLIDNEIYSKESHNVITHYEVGKKYNPRTLKRMTNIL